MNVLLITAHSIAAYDDVRMLTDLGRPTLDAEQVAARARDLVEGKAEVREVA